MQRVLNIAVVEDDADDREFIESALVGSWPGVRIHSFSSASMFMGALGKKSFHPELIVTDLRMPVMSGFELISNLKDNAATSNIPVVVLSTSQNEEDVRRATELGAAAYFVKPYSIEGFEEISKGILRKFSGFKFSLTEFLLWPFMRSLFLKREAIS